MRVSWPIVQLRDISKINYGYTAKASFEADGPKFLRITDIQNGKVFWDSVPSCPISDEDYEKHKLLENDIVFARTGATTGKSFRVTNPPISVPASYLIRLRLESDEVLPEFVMLFFQTAEYWETINAGTTGSAQGGFNASKLGELAIPKPHIEEQKRIVAILDEAFAGIDTAIANTEKNLANARELFESYLNSVFTQRDKDWVEKKFEDLVSSTTIGLVRNKKEQGEDFKYKYIKMNNISNDNRLYDASTVKVDATEKEVEKFSLQAGDFLFNTRNSHELVGKSCLYKGASTEPVLYNNNIMRVRFNEEVDSSFIAHAFNSIGVKEQLESIKSGTTNVSAIYYKTLKEVLLAFPGIAEQEVIVSKLDELQIQVQSLILIYQSKLESLKELKQSLLQKAFSGELTAEGDKLMDEAVA